MIKFSVLVSIFAFIKLPVAVSIFLATEDIGGHFQALQVNLQV